MLLGQIRLPSNPTFSDGYTLADRVEQARRDNKTRAAAWTELRQAAGAAQRVADNFSSRYEATVEAYDRRNALIHRQTGVQMKNPYDLASEGPEQAVELRQNVLDWQAEVDALKGRFPDVDFGSIETDRQAVVQEAEQRYQDASRKAGETLSWYGRFGAELAGRGLSSLRDPLQIATLAVGGSGVKAATALGRIGMTMLQEAVINAGVEAVLQTAVQKWRAENGLDAGLAQGLEQVGLAGLFGGGIGGAVRGVMEGLKALGKAGDVELRAAAERMAGGTPQAGDTERLAAGLGIDLSDLERKVGRIAEEQSAADRVSFGEAPGGVDPGDVEDLIAGALRHVDDNDLPPPDGAIALPPRSADIGRVVVEDLPAPGGRLTVQGRPARFERFDPDQLQADAASYQYKAGGDEAGVTDRLAGVRQWDATASGKVLVHERSDGRFIADGHQRLGLAKRLKAEGDASVSMDGYLFREADGWSVEDVRALAARKNMQEGSGTAMDAARILRDRPDLLDDGLPVSGPMMKKAVNLSRLSDDAWGLVVNEVARQHHGEAVGRIVTDPTKHHAVLAEVAKADPETERMTDLFVREVLAADFVREEQVDIFGSAAVTRSLLPERVKILDEAMKLLRRDKRLFAALTNNAELIEAAGNVLDSSGNRDIASTAETVLALIDRLARARGPISDFLTEAAERYAGGSTAAREARGFVSSVQDTLSKRGLRGLLEEEPRPVLKPAATAEPASPEAAGIAEQARLEAAGTPDIGRQSALAIDDDLFDQPPDISLHELYRAAPALQRTLEDAGADIEAETGARFSSGGIKSRVTAEEKIARKSYRSAAELTDVVRGGFLVETPEQAENVVRALEDRFTIADEGWNVTDEGYVDRKVLVRFDDGIVGEIQLWEPHMRAVKDAGGHELYTAWRRMKPNDPAASALKDEMRALYSAAAREASAEWAAIARPTSSGPNLFSNRARHSSSDIRAAVWETSAKSAGTQSPPGRVTASAPSSNSSAGRRSQLTNFMGDTSDTPNIVAISENSIPSTGQNDASLWDVMPDGVDADGQTRFTDFAREAGKADLLEETADLIKACKD